MLSEEEIENVEHAIKNFNGRAIDCVAIGNMLLEYQKLETREQKLIDKLEEDIENDYHIEKPYRDEYCIYEIENISTKEYAQEILSIVKGEKK